MATIQSTGIGSGLDVQSIVSQLMALEKRPLNLLAQSATKLNTQLSAIGKLQSLTSTMRDAANSLTSLTMWGQTVATSANPAAVQVSTSGGAVAGSYAVKVDALAAAQTVSSPTFNSKASTLSAGTLTIELGAWSGEPEPSGFTAKADSAPVTIEIGADETSLEKIRDKINSSNAGVSASLINDASGTRLALRSKETGAENAFRISASASGGAGDSGSSLAALAFDATSTGSPLTRNQSASNARATINGIDVNSATNTLAEVSDGLTITLLQKSEAEVDVGVAPDTEAIKTAITKFTSSFNDVANYIREQTKYNPDSKTGGLLQGDRLVTGLQSQMRALLNQGSNASSTWERMSDIGIGFAADGTLTTQTSKLDNALKNLPELRKLLTADGADAASSGFVDRFKDFTAVILGSDGSFESRNKSIQSMLQVNSKRQDGLSQRLTQTEARLYKQYQSLDTNLSKLNSVSSYLTQQLTMLNKSASGG